MITFLPFPGSESSQHPSAYLLSTWDTKSETCIASLWVNCFLHGRVPSAFTFFTEKKLSHLFVRWSHRKSVHRYDFSLLAKVPLEDRKPNRYPEKVNKNVKEANKVLADAQSFYPSAMLPMKPSCKHTAQHPLQALSDKPLSVAQASLCLCWSKLLWVCWDLFPAKPVWNCSLGWIPLQSWEFTNQLK